MSSTPFLIYGANGYTGTLVAEEAARRGLRPIVAGRRREEVEALAARLELEPRVFDLSSPREVDAGLDGVRLVLHCAGPFADTYRAMVEGCLRAGAHYTDITGEVEVLEAIAARDGEARRRGILLLPGAGFDVVPTDCLAAHLARRLPQARWLTLAFQSTGGVSRGTATTTVRRMATGGRIRRGGKIIPVPLAWRTRELDLGLGRVRTMTIPWGDVATAYHTTGIPNIEVYMAAPPPLLVATMVMRWLRWLLLLDAVRTPIFRRIRSRGAGPSAAERARGGMYIWGEVRDGTGHAARARLRGPDGYSFTVLTALGIAERVLAGQVRPGFATPAGVYGPSWVLELPGVVREDL